MTLSLSGYVGSNLLESREPDPVCRILPILTERFQSRSQSSLPARLSDVMAAEDDPMTHRLGLLDNGASLGKAQSVQFHSQ